MICSRIQLFFLLAAFALLPISSLVAQNLNGGNTPFPQELQSQVDSPNYEKLKTDWIEAHPGEYAKMEVEAKANFVPSNNPAVVIPNEQDNTALPWFNYDGETDIKAAKLKYYNEKPQEYQAYLRSVSSEK